MRKIILLFALLSLAHVCPAAQVSETLNLSDFSISTASNNIWYRYAHGECPICGAPMNEESNSYYTDSMTYFPMVYKLGFFDSLKVCSDCFEKYNPALQKEMQSIYESFISHAKAENYSVRADREAGKRKERIKELERELQELRDK